jgi:hypothetical protein
VTLWTPRNAGFIDTCFHKTQLILSLENFPHE